jgi:hypothetical protein
MIQFLYIIEFWDPRTKNESGAKIGARRREVERLGKDTARRRWRKKRWIGRWMEGRGEKGASMLKY